MYDYLYNDLSVAKSDINYHWDEIGKKIEAKKLSKDNQVSCPPIVKIRQFCNVSVVVQTKKSKWISVQKTKSNMYIMNDNKLLDYVMNDALNNGDYVCIGAVGCGCGLETNNSTQLSITMFSDVGVRVYNNSSKDIKTLTSITRNDGSEGEHITPGTLKTCPPYLDLLYIRKDIVDYCY